MFTQLVWVLALRVSVFVSRERGQDLTEYALLGGLLAMAFLGGGLLLSSGALPGLFADFARGFGACIDFKASTDCAV